MKKKNSNAIIFMILGLVLLVAGLGLIIGVSDPKGTMEVLPYIFIGLGCGIFGHNLGEILSYKAIEKNPDIAKNIEIEKNDERNIAISNKSKAKAYDLMIYVYGAMMIAFGLMRVKTEVVITLVIAYLFIIFSAIYFRSKYEKEM